MGKKKKAEKKKNVIIYPQQPNECAFKLFKKKKSLLL